MGTWWCALTLGGSLGQPVYGNTHPPTHPSYPTLFMLPHLLQVAIPLERAGTCLQEVAAEIYGALCAAVLRCGQPLWSAAVVSETGVLCMLDGQPGIDWCVGRAVGLDAGPACPQLLLCRLLTLRPAPAAACLPAGPAKLWEGARTPWLIRFTNGEVSGGCGGGGWCGGDGDLQAPAAALIQTNTQSLPTLTPLMLSPGLLPKPRH